jgi:hypothetical protein
MTWNPPEEGSKDREEMPSSCFLDEQHKKYPYKKKKDGKWVPDEEGLLAAERRANQFGKSEIANKARKLLDKYFPKKTAKYKGDSKMFVKAKKSGIFTLDDQGYIDFDENKFADEIYKRIMKKKETLKHIELYNFDESQILMNFLIESEYANIIAEEDDIEDNSGFFNANEDGNRVQNTVFSLVLDKFCDNIESKTVKQVFSEFGKTF